MGYYSDDLLDEQRITARAKKKWAASKLWRQPVLTLRGKCPRGRRRLWRGGGQRSALSAGRREWWGRAPRPAAAGSSALPSHRSRPPRRRPRPAARRHAPLLLSPRAAHSRRFIALQTESSVLFNSILLPKLNTLTVAIIFLNKLY